MLIAGGGGGGAPRAVVSTHVNTGGTAQQVSYSVDLDQIPGLIAKYENARQKLTVILRKARDIDQLGDHARPGDDEVSRNATTTLLRKAGDSPGSLAWSVRDAIDRITSQIEQLKAAKAGYEANEEAAVSEMPRYV